MISKFATNFKTTHFTFIEKLYINRQGFNLAIY